MLKKRLLGLCLLSLFVSHSVLAGDCPTPGPAAWWKAQNDATDSAGANNGTLEGGAGFAAGMVGQAFNMGGPGDYVSFPDSPSLRPASLTIEGWFNRTSDADAIQIMVAKRVGSETLNSYALIFINGAPFAFISDGATPLTFLIGGSFLNLGEWHHIAYTFDNATGMEALYVDGALVAGPSASQNGTSIGYDASPVFIGRDVDDPPMMPQEVFSYNGLADEVTIYDRALSLAEIQGIFTAGSAGKCAPASPCTLTCPVDVVAAAEAGICGATVTYAAPGQAGTCTGVACMPTSGTVFAVGTTPVMCTSTEGGMCTFNVTVNDNENPTVMGCPANMGPLASGSTVSWVAPSVSDNCPGASIMQTAGPMSGTVFPDGMTTVTYMATDAAGNSVTCSFTVTVNPAGGGGRVTFGIVALYDFNTMSGTTVFDVGGSGVPLDLTILDPAKIQWLGGGMNGVRIVASGSAISSPGAATKIHAALGASDQLTMEAWVAPDNLTQSGPARIATLSEGINNSQVNAHLGQGAGASSPGVTGSGRLRTSAGTFNWLQVPDIFTSAAALVHVVLTYDGSTLKMYKDGVQQGPGIALSGNLDNWDPAYPLVLGNEATLDRSWLGILRLVAIYDRALNLSEVMQNFAAGPSGAPPPCVPPSISTPPADVTVTEPNAAMFSVTASGTGPLSYQWFRGMPGVMIPGATTSTYTLSPTSVGADAGAKFSVEVKNACGMLTSALATLTVDPSAPCIAPSISTPPADVTVTEPNGAMFSVTAGGTGPLSYQWFRGMPGVAIPGATTSTYTLSPTSVGADDAAKFSVEVKNACGMETSTMATLTVNPSGGGGRVTSGIVALYDFNTMSGTTVFDVGGFGAPLDLTILDPAKIQWLGGGMNGVRIVASGSGIRSPGAATKVHAALGASDRMTMEAWVAPDNLTQFGPARIATLSEGINSSQVNAHLGQGVGTFSAGMTGSGRLRTSTGTFNWLQVPNIFTGAAALVHVVLTYDGSTLKMYKDGVQQGPGIAVSGNLDNWNPAYPLVLGNEASFDRSWLGILRLVAIYDRALNLSEIMQNFAAGPSGAPGPCVPPSISTPPADLTVTEPNAAMFSVTASGTGPFSYQWFRGMPPVMIPGATSATYTLSPTSMGADNGAQFSVEVMNACGMATSGSATLTVDPPATRITSGLIALYLFNEMGGGTTVKDRSGFAPPLDLTILDPAKIVRLGGGVNGVRFMASGSAVGSAAAASKVHTALIAANQLTMEAWIQPDSLSQFGPARIATLSEGITSAQVDAHLGQGAGTFSTGTTGSGRLRTTANPFNWLQVPNTFTSLALVHVVLTYDGATLKLFKDGLQQGPGLAVMGNLNNWNTAYPLMLGNEATLDRSWLGTMRLFAIYDRALTPGEIVTNFGAGPGAPLAPFVGPEPGGPILEVEAAGSQVLLKLTGAAGESYIVEHSTNLVNWEPVVTVTLPDTDPAVWADTIEVNGAVGFFRAALD